MTKRGVESDSGIIEVGRIALDLDRTVARVDGEDVVLRPQSFDVLKVLIENRGRLVTRQQLLDAVWGNTAVTDSSITQCLVDIRRVLSDSEKKIVRTIPRRGYIFDGDLVSAERDRDSSGDSNRRFSTIVGAIILVAIVSAASYLTWNPDDAPATAGPLSIAVLPFVDLTEAQDKRFLGEGLSEEILNLLSRSPSLTVIARTSSFSFSGRDADLERIGSELGVTHVLQGSVRQGDDRLRISAQLVTAPEGRQLWADSYDQPFGDILRIQSEVAESVAAELHVSLQLGVDDSADVDPYVHALVIQARNRIRLIEDGAHSRAREMLDQALEIDPDYVPALLTKSLVLYADAGDGMHSRHEDELRSIELADRALELAPDDAIANAQRGWLELHHFKNFENAARYYERAMALDNTNPDVIQPIVNAAVVLNRPELGVQLGEYLVARDPLCELCYSFLSLAARVSGKYEIAIQAMERVLEFNPNSKVAYLNLGNALLASGDPASALNALERQASESPNLLMLKAMAHHQLGHVDEFARLRDQLIDRYGDTAPLLIAYVEAVNGDKESAFARLAENAEMPVWRRGLGGFRNPVFEGLHDDPRWQEYLDAMGWSEEIMDAIGFNPILPF